MIDVINIVVHPGYLVTHDEYDENIYHEQLSKGKLNIFLHPQISKEEAEIWLTKDYDNFIKELKLNKTWVEVKEDAKAFSKNDKFIFYGVAAYYIRQFLFRRFKRTFNLRNKRNKAYSVLLVRLAKKLKTKVIKAMTAFTVDGTYIFKNHCNGSKHKEFRTNLEEKYSDDIDKQMNLHLHGTTLNSFNHLLKRLIKENAIEESDEFYVFGENYNQCVKNAIDVIIKHDIKINIKTELTTYNHSSKIDGYMYKQENNHFLEINKNDK